MTPPTARNLTFEKGTANALRYDSFISEFDDGLDAADYEKAKSAYKKLIDILHPDNPTRRLLEIQLSRLKYDKTE